ncbi:MAG: hypothetical protein B7Z37_24690 [Verrucomicrobia bacterium 12-59-8]|nr:MAG: hypothetical protein B7Z37_24690 [Verrucomicrobia bacterium 12-59-8]
MRHGVEIGAHRALDPGLAVGHGTDHVTGGAVDLGGGGCLRHRLGGVIGEVHANQEQRFFRLRPSGGLLNRKGLEGIHIDLAVGVRAVWKDQYGGGGHLAGQRIQPRQFCGETCQLGLTGEHVGPASGDGLHSLRPHGLSGHHAAAGHRLPWGEQFQLAAVHTLQHPVPDRRRAIQRDALHRQALLAH